MSKMKVIFILVMQALLATPAAAYVDWTPETLLASYFPAPATVEEVAFTPDAETRDRLKSALGYALPRPTVAVHVGHDGSGVLGYALLDSQLGQHEPIDFGVLFTPEGAVARVEVLVYREAYGEGVRAEGFRRQFIGLGPSAPMRPGKDIRIVSGATVSTRSISVGVRRATLLLAAFLGRPLA